MTFLEIKENSLIDASKTMYPSNLYGHTRGTLALKNETSTYFGFVNDGRFTLKGDHGLEQPLIKGMYFSMTGPAEFTGNGQAVVIERFGYRGLNQIGGPVEDRGRLCYIDNCSTSILVSPPRLGDPVFNLLVFPPGTNQTMHIHPTVRLGIVYEGHGECVTPNADPLPLKPGMAFYLHEEKAHCFRSFDKTMKIIAFHPDSDVGPTDSSHPMLSRTYTKF
jgi:hypothetical protein